MYHKTTFGGQTSVAEINKNKRKLAEFKQQK